MSDAAAWITGAGVIGPHGSGWASLVDALRAPRPFFTPTPDSWAAYPGAAAGFVGALPPEAEELLQPFDTASTDRSCAMALACAQQAWAQAAPQGFDERRAGVYWGTGMGGLHTTETSYNRLMLQHAPLRPTTVVRIMANAAASQLAIKYKLRGPNATYSIACASSASALGEALMALRAGRIDIALVGGSEAMLVPGVMAAWNALRVLSTRKNAADPTLPSRPFSTARSGLVIGEGAAAFILESPRHARARGAVPLAALAGYGSNCDAASLVHPQTDGQVHAMGLALDDAGISPAQIGAVNAHATGTDAGDIAEARALAEVFPGGVAVSATKSMHGHLLGAAGAMEAAICIASLQLQQVPASLGCEPLDPRCGDVGVSARPRPAALGHVLSNSFAFGGANVSLVFRHAGELR